MNDEARTERPVKLQTGDYAIQGSLRVSPVLRTLDDLNVVSRHFVTLHSPVVEVGERTLDDGPLAVATASILFLQELGSPPTRRGTDFGRFTKAPIRLSVGKFEIQGFVHVPPGGTPIKRFDQFKHSFVPLTSVLVEGPTGDFATPFLAVNREFVVLAQQVSLPEESRTEVLVSSSTED